MKKIINILLALVLIIVSAFTLVACGGDGQNAGKKGLLLKKYSGEDFYTVYGYVDEGEGLETLDIGAVAGEKNVGRIAKEAFAGNDTLVEVIVPDTVTEIAQGAFKKMKKLSKITLPFVGKTAVADSYMYETDETDGKAVDSERIFAHIFGEEEYSYGELIAPSYGAGTTTCYIPASLTEVTIKPAGEYKIPMYAFASTLLLQKVNLVGNITAIGENAFQGCRDLMNVNIPSTVKTIEANAFEGCTFLKAVSFDENSQLTEIKEKAFSKVGLSKIELPASLQVIGVKAFMTSALEEVVLPASLTAVKGYAFYGCEFLKVLNVSKVTGEPSLGVSAFEDCKSLAFTSEIDNVWSSKGANYNKNTKALI